MRERDDDGLLSAACALAVLVATFSFLPIVNGIDWWGAALVFTIAAVTVSAGARRLGAPTLAGALLAVTVIPLLATAFDGAGRSLLVILPTHDSSVAVMQTLNDAWAQIYADTVPAEASPGIILLIASGAAMAVVVVDAVAVGLRAPLPAMLVVLALTIVPGKALRTGTNGWLLAAVAIAVLLVIAADRRRRGSAPRVGGLVAGGAAALVLALVAQIVLPAPFASDAQGLPLQPLFGPGADPLIRLGDNLRRGPQTPVLTYTTSTGDDVYLRLAVLENFTGATWSPNTADRYGIGVRDQAPPVPGLSETIPVKTVTTNITAAGDDAIGQWLPLPYPAREVDGVFGFDWDTRGLALARRDTTTTIRSYTVTSDALDITAARLRTDTTSLPPSDRGSLAVPGTVPAIVKSTAAAWTKGATTPYAAALAIQNHLRDGFGYDEQTPVQQGYDGDGLGVIAKFLSVRSGYCVHFASTMAVLARLEGIPSRVVVGYQPGQRSVVGGRNVYQVTSDDLHAWPELYFDGVGWVRFEPTPGRGVLASYAPQPKASAAASDLPGKSAHSTTPTAVPTPTSSAVVGSRTDGTSGGSIGGVLRGVGIALLVIAAGLIPAGLRRLIRRRRFAQLRRAGPAEVGWQEVVDTGADFGVSPRPGVSLRAAELDLRSDLGAASPAASALTRIREAYERQIYGGRSQRVSADDVDRVLTTIRGHAGFWRRLRATLAPRSLVGTLTSSRLRAGA